MSNKRKLDLIRSLKPGDIVITGNHIGAIRYLGPLEGLDHKNQNPDDRTKIYNLYAGIELTEPNGHMDGSMHINGKKITYFTTTYGNNLKKRKRKQQNNLSENESKYDNENIDDEDDPKYGILIPAISIQKKIDSFTLLKKITMVFQQYKIIKKRLNYYKNQSMHRTDQQSNQNTQSLIDIKTNSDLISPPTTSGYSTRANIPISQPSIISNNYSSNTTIVHPVFNSNNNSNNNSNSNSKDSVNNNNNNTYKYKKFPTAPVYNNGNTYNKSNINNNNVSNNNTDNYEKLSLRKINSAPYLRSEMQFDDPNNSNGQIQSNAQAINNGYLMHKHSHTMHHQPYEQNTNQRLFTPHSNVTTPHIDDEINNSDFPSISNSEDQPTLGPTLDKFSKSYTDVLINKTVNKTHYKKQLNSYLPSPHRYKLNRRRGQSFKNIGNYKSNTNPTTPSAQSRIRGNSYASHMATKRTPEPPNNNSPSCNNKLKIISNKISQSPLSCPVSPAISHQTMVINTDDNPNESTPNTIHSDTNDKGQLSENNISQKPAEIMVRVAEFEELPKLPTTVLSPMNSQKSDQTMNTQRSRVVSVTGHHPSASMYTHAPLNHWNDSTRYDKLTSIGGSADKNKDLSSLAIKISSPRHTRPKSAMNFNQRESLGINNKIQHVANKDSVQLKQLLEDLKKNKLNQILTISDIEVNNNKESKNSKNTMNILTDDSSDDSVDQLLNNNDDDEDLPKLMDNHTTAATVHSPTADVLENMVTHSVASSPEEKLAEVENNEDEKQLLPTDVMSDIATPIPKEKIDVDVDIDFDVFDVDENDANNNTIENIPKRLSLTESSLRKHNKRRGSRDQIQFLTSNPSNTILELESSNINIDTTKNNNDEIVKIKNYVFHPQKIQIHHHQQTLSEPMLPKFALMMRSFDSSSDEKSASSDGEDTQSLGMENNLEDSVHTHDVTEADVHFMQHNTDIITTPKPKNNNNNNNNNKLFSPTFTADSISRRSSVNLTSGVWDYITPKNQDIDIADASIITLYNLSNDGDSSSIGYQTPKQQYIRRMAGPGTGNTPTYSSYKTRHEYLRDMTYFTTLHRAQQFKKLQKEKIETLIENTNEEKAANPQQREHLKGSNSITSLDIIQEKIFDDENINNDKEQIDTINDKDINDENNNNSNCKDEQLEVGHRPQLSCDTRAAIEGGIEPYKPTQHILHQSAMV